MPPTRAGPRHVPNRKLCPLAHEERKDTDAEHAK